MYYAIKHTKSQEHLQFSKKYNFMLYKAKNIGFITIQENDSSAQNTGQPLKILFVITQGVWGGSQRYVLDMATELSKKHSITVAIGEPHGSKDLQNRLSFEKNKINIVQLKHLQRSPSLFQDLFALFELQKLIQKVQPDIVHLNSTKAGLIGSLAGALQKKLHQTKTKSFPKIVYTVHGWIFLESLPKFTKKLFQWLEQHTLRFKNAFIVLSDEENTIGRTTLNIPESKIITIPLGISIPPIILTKNEARKKIQFMIETKIDASKWIGTIAGLYKTKGLDILIQSLAQEKELQKNHYFILGEGPERQNLTNLIQTLHLENTITLLGHIENASLLLPAFDMVVLPSRKEGLPYALLETMHYELPIIATKVGGVPSLLQKYKNALLIEPNNKQELTEALCTFSPSTHHVAKNTFPLEKMITSSQELYYSLLLQQ